MLSGKREPIKFGDEQDALLLWFSLEHIKTEPLKSTLDQAAAATPPSGIEYRQGKFSECDLG